MLRFRNTYVFALAMVLLLALAVRVHVARSADLIARDGTVYLHMARELCELPAGEVARRYHYHPGYPAAIAAAARLTGASWPDGWIAAAQAVSVFMGIVALASVYFIAAAVFDRRIALVTVLLLGLGGAFVEISSDVISDAQAVGLAMLSVALALGARRRLREGRRSAILLAGGAGLAAGAGYLTRPEELLAAGVAVVLLLAVGGLSRRGRKIQLAAIVLLAAVTFACVVPYAVAIGSLTQKKGVSDFVLAAQGGLPLAAVTIPIELLSALRKTLDRGREAMSTGVGALAAVCWATWVGRYVLRLRLPKSVLVRPTRVGAFVMFAPAVVMVPLLTALEYRLAPGASSYISTRHALMLAMFLAPCGGAGLMILVAWTVRIGERLGIKPRPALAFGVWLAGFAAVMAVWAFPVLHEGKACHRVAGAEIRKQSGPGHFILASAGWAPFYAGAPSEQFTCRTKMSFQLTPRDTGSVGKLLARCAGDGQRRYSFLVLDSRLTAKADNPQLISQLRKHPRFRRIATFSSGGKSGRKNEVWVFRILPPDQAHNVQTPSTQ